ncbi:MAG: TIGR02099 family protein [Proteobacteria bacterium]|nr:TIGR02099 family protein [Pseudomonadota bacterium]
MSLKIILRRARTLIWTAMSILIILAAVLVGVGKLLMPYSDRYQDRLEAWLSKEFGRPVVVESFQGEWNAFGPRLTLHGMRLLPSAGGDPGESGVIAIESAALDIKPLNALIPGRPLYNFRVIGADLQLLLKADGRLELSGFGVSGRGTGGSSSGLMELAKVGEVILQDSSLEYVDEKHDIHLRFSSINGRLHMDGDEFSTEIQASLYDARSELVYGEVQATLLFFLDEDQKMTQAAWQASTRELMLAALQGKLPANPFLPLTGWLNAELWGDWSPSEGLRIQGVSDLKDARLVSNHQDLAIDHLNMRFNWHFREKGRWRLDIADFLFEDDKESWTAPNISLARNIPQDVGLWISADQLPLGFSLGVTRDIMSIYATQWPASLPQAILGRVDELELILNNSWQIELVRGSLSGVSVAASDRWPGVQGLDAVVALQHGSGSISLTGSKVLLDWPRMFDQRLHFTVPTCHLDLAWGEQWQAGLDDCKLENEDLAITGRVVIGSNEDKPAIDASIVLTRGAIGRLDAYWPEALMSENIVRWLRRSLVEGEIVNGRAQMHGDLDDWPFAQGEGRLEAVVEVRNVLLDYKEGWPQAKRIDAVIRFVNNSMEIEGRIGEIGGVPVHSARANIPNMKLPVLAVNYSADSELSGLLHFIKQSPIQQHINTDLSRFEFSGPASIHGDLILPLGRARGEMSVNGQVHIQHNRFSDPASEITFENINGELQYNHRGFKGLGLKASFKGQPASIDVMADADHEEKFRADVKGHFSASDAIPGFLLERYSALAQIEGSSDWEASIVIGPPDGGDASETVLLLRSDLEGVDLNLPAPLNKSAGDRWPLLLRYPLSGETRLLDIEIGDRATVRFKLSGGSEIPQSAVIRLGQGRPELPPDGFIRIEGNSRKFDLDGWVDLIIDQAIEGEGLGGLEMETGRLVTGQLVFLDRLFSDVTVEFNVVESDLKVSFSGEDIDGKVSFTRRGSGPPSLSAEFERLALADPISSGMEMDSDPADLPSLHLYVKSFRYAGIELGETRVEAYPTPTGFHFEKVETASDQLTVKASGDWSLENHQHRSNFDIHMTSESLGSFLQSMDISSSMKGGQTMVRFSAWWPGSPAKFALSRLNGEVEFTVVQGNIKDANTGIGRLLGLLSIQSLPKRLALDFRDVFDSGFSFDEASGTFALKNGLAITDDVRLKSPAATISMSGSTDLVDQQYDQLLTIKPGLGNTLPIIGVIAAGPGGAAAGLALQGLLQEQLGEATQVQYSISGSWDEPVIELVIDPPAEG